MASTIQIKNSSTGGNSPSSLAQGELAINVADGNLFYGDGSSVLQRFAITELTASSNVSISGSLTLDGNLIINSTGDYLVDPNRYAFRYSADTDAGLFFNASTANYEFRDLSAASIFSIGATTGNTVIGGTLTIPGFTDVSASLAAAVAGGDDLGNHTATQDLNMGGNAITNVGNVDGVDVSALNTTVSTNTSNIATLTAATSSYLTTVDISDDTNLTAGTGITLTGDTLSTNDSQIVHDNLSGFVANEHIDHSTVSITAGNGLTGGGTIASTRTLNVGAGDGISVAADSVAVDSTVLRTTGDSVLSSSAQIASDISGAFTAGGGISLSGGEFSVSAGTGLTQGATGLSFDADGGTLTTNNADVDHILINDGGTFKRIAKGNINVGDFNNNVGYLTTVDISTDTNLVGGTNLTLSGDTMNLDANISLTNITASIVSASYYYGTPIVKANEYAFRYESNAGVIQNTGLFFNAATGQYEFLDSTSTCVFCIKAGTGNTMIAGNLTASSDVDIQGILSIPGFTDVSASLAAAVAGGDNLGNHTATQNLNMGGYAITNVGNVDGRDVSADGSKLDGIEAGADVTDTANVTAAGALMDSEVDADIKTLSLPANTTISTFGASLIDDTTATAARTTLGLGSMATQTSTDYVSINGDTLQGALDLGTYNITNVGELRATTVSGSTFVSDGVTVVSTPDAQTVKIGQSAGGSGPMKVSIVSSDTQYGLFSNSGIQLTGSVDISSTLSIPGFADVSASLAAAGTVDTTGTPANNQIAIFTDSNTIEGDSNLTWTGNVLNIGSNGDTAKFTTLSSIIFNGGNDDQSFQVKGSGDDNLLQVNPQLNDRVGIGTSTPSQKLTVAGNISASGDLSIQGFTSVSASLAAASGGGGGTVTEVTVGTGLDVTNGTTTPNITLDLTEITLSSGLDSTATGLSLDLTEVGFAPGTANKLITNDGDGTVTTEINLGFDGTTLDVNGKIDVDYSTNSDAVVDISNNTSAIMSVDHYALKVAGGQAIGTPGGQNKAYGGYFTAGNTNGTNPDTIALYAQGHEDGAPNSYAAIFSGSAGGVVGINTMEPTVELDVVGDISASNDVRIVNNLSLGAVADVETRISSYRVAIMSNGFYAQPDLRYLTYNTTTETTSNNYISIIPAAANGRVISVTCWPQSSGGSSVLSFYVNGGTASATDTQTLTSGVPVQFTFSSGNTFSALDELSFSIDPTNTPNGLSFQIILEYDY